MRKTGYRTETMLPSPRICAFGEVGVVFPFEITRRDSEMSVTMVTKKESPKRSNTPLRKVFVTDAA